MIQPLIDGLKSAAKNKHTTGAGAAYLGALAVSHIGAIWFPHHAEQFKQTGDAIQGLAVAYGLIMAGDAKKDVDEDEDDKQSPKP